jgi:hypothetical protein
MGVDIPTDQPGANADLVSATLEQYGIARGTIIRDEPTYPLSRGVSTTFCAHNQHVIDDVKREVTCGRCGAHLDPITVLASYANDPAWVLQCRRERVRLEREIDALKKDVSSLKAMKKRASATPARVVDESEAQAPPRRKR